MLVIDYRLGGKPRYILKTARSRDMLVPADIRKCVAFICYRDHQQMIKFAGTAFFVSRQSQDESTYRFVYIVTAKHVIQEIEQHSVDSSVVLRLNTKAGSYQEIDTDSRDWLFHETEPAFDVAILNWAPPSNEIDYLHFPLEAAATDEIIFNEEIGLGDEVFLAGLFTKHYGKHNNIPIVRVGNIAAMPEEPVKTKMGLMDAYLIEARSIGGLSGSPVFVHLGPIRTSWDKEKETKIKGDKFFLLGLVHGHWDVPFDEQMDVGGDKVGEDKINMGIAVVVPVSKIIEVIDHPKFKEIRERVEEKRRKESLPTPDNAHNEKPFTRDNFLSDLKKASRRVADDRSDRRPGKPEKAK
ncbi:MAG: hypothetical protein AB1500_01470 [Bacillota bacterium]